MGFVSYPHLILLNIGQTIEATVAQEKFWELNRPLKFWSIYGLNFRWVIFRNIEIYFLPLNCVVDVHACA